MSLEIQKKLIKMVKFVEKECVALVTNVHILQKIIVLNSKMNFVTGHLLEKENVSRSFVVKKLQEN